MSYTPEQLFANWYQKVDTNLNKDIIDKRIKAIEAIILENDIPFWQNIIYLYLGIPTSDKEKFANFFVKTDSIFPIVGNDNIIRILASITLSFKLYKEKTELSYKISLGIINANLLNQYELEDVGYVYEYATTNTLNTNKVIRNFTEIKTTDFDDLVSNLENEDIEEETELIQPLKETGLNLIKSFKGVLNNQLILSEEIETLWWIFGEYSSVADKPFKDVGYPKMVLFAAVELFWITSFNSALVRSKEFISKVLIMTDSELVKMEISVFDFINFFTLEEKQKVLKYYKPEVSHLTPLITAFKLSTEFKTGDDWSVLYKNRLCDGDIKLHMQPIKIAFQIYTELIFLYNL